MNEDFLKTSRSIAYLVIFLLLLATVLVIIFLVVPQVEKVYQAKDDLEERRIQLDQARTDAMTAQRFAEEKQTVEQDYSLIENALLGEGNLVNFIEELEFLAEISGNQLEISQHQANKKKAQTPTLALPGQDPTVAEEKARLEEEKEKNTIRLKLVLRGNYRQFLRYLYWIQNMPNVFDIDSVAVRSASASRGLKLEDIPVDEAQAEILISFLKN